MEYLDTKDDEYTLEVFDLDEPIERKTQIYEISFELDKKKVIDVDIYWDESYKDMIHIGGRYFRNKKTLDIYVESDSRKRALKIASERYGAIIAGEQTMYPYLRVGVLRHYSNMCPPFRLQDGRVGSACDQRWLSNFHRLLRLNEYQADNIVQKQKPSEDREAGEPTTTAPYLRTELTIENYADAQLATCIWKK